MSYTGDENICINGHQVPFIIFTITEIKTFDVWDLFVVFEIARNVLQNSLT